MPKSKTPADPRDLLPPEMRNTTITIPGRLSDRYSVIAAKLKISRAELLTRLLKLQADNLEILLGLPPPTE